MNETADTQEFDQDNPQETTNEPEVSDMSTEVIRKYIVSVSSAQQHAMELLALATDNTFKHVSKKARNAMLLRLLNESRDVEELGKVVFRTFKKIKRERIQENGVDRLLGVDVDNLNLNEADDEGSSED